MFCFGTNLNLGGPVPAARDSKEWSYRRNTTNHQDSIWGGAIVCRGLRVNTWAGVWEHRPWVKAYVAGMEDPFDATDNPGACL